MSTDTDDKDQIGVFGGVIPPQGSLRNMVLASLGERQSDEAIQRQLAERRRGSSARTSLITDPLNLLSGHDVAAEVQRREASGIPGSRETGFSSIERPVGQRYGFDGGVYHRPNFDGVVAPALSDYTRPANLDGTLLSMRTRSSPGASGDVLIYTSANFDPTKPITFIPYLTGHGGSPEDFFRRQYRDSNVNAVYIVPRLGHYSETRGGFTTADASQLIAEAGKAMMDKQIAMRAAQGRPYTAEEIAQINANAQGGKVTTGIYSGGYVAGNAFLPLSSRVISYDAMYGSVYTANLIKFAQAGGVVEAYFGDSTAGNTGSFRSATRGLANVNVMGNGGSHGDLVQRVFASSMNRTLDATNGVTLASNTTQPRPTAGGTGLLS